MTLMRNSALAARVRLDVAQWRCPARPGSRVGRAQRRRPAQGLRQVHRRPGPDSQAAHRGRAKRPRASPRKARCTSPKGTAEALAGIGRSQLESAVASPTTQRRRLAEFTQVRRPPPNWAVARVLADAAGCRSRSSGPSPSSSCFAGRLAVTLPFGLAMRHDVRMTASIEYLRFGDLDVRVSVVQLPGTEKTSAADRLRDRAVDALEQAQSAIEAVARSATNTIDNLKAANVSPSNVEIELGLAFTAQGSVVVAGAGVQASMVVHLSYEV